MHKRNITLVAMLLAAVLAGALLLSPAFKHSDAIGVLYAPAIILAILFSGGSHSPSAIADWSSFIVYTLFFWVFFLIIYAVLWQMHLVRKASRHLGRGEDLKLYIAAAESDPRKALERIGIAIAETEARRRKHLLLKRIDLDLNEGYELIAARAVTEASNERFVKSLLKRVEARLRKEIGAQNAANFMTKLKSDARNLVSPHGDSNSAAPSPGLA
jgi:hypothetical protein